MKNKIVIGNWKMNNSFTEAEELLTSIANIMEDMTLETEIVICPAFPYLEMAADLAEDNSFPYYIGAQNVSSEEKGAYTGEVSALMIKSSGADFCIIGHSERRMYFHETNVCLRKKTDIAIVNDLIPIFCVGEQLVEREAQNHFTVIENQLKESLFHLDRSGFERVILAYEPVWAIGTGITATPAQAQEMHAFIRSLVAEKYGTEQAYNTYILYGGSCNSKNALDLFLCKDIDGGLIGGASLTANEFIEIIRAAETSTKND
ncbi:MAG: triose-phosphate isomerase [Bacteroidales bacterium]|jgi:triosephosphate isomerase|nr:triose-phosphate isomerase [Bacteroidales bacterium]